MKMLCGLFVAVLLAAPSFSEDLAEPSYLGELDALDDYSLMGILDLLGYKDLLNLAMLSPRVQQLFGSHYIRKYDWDKKEVLLTLTSEDGDMLIRRNNWYQMSENYPETLFILRYFGHIFTSIEIRIYSIEHVEQVQILINKYCSKASQKIEIFEGNIAYVPDVQLLFEHVTTVTITGRPFSPNHPFRFDAAFPQMRKLTFECELDLNHHYPHLTAIVFKHYEYNSDLAEFVRLNPQLRTIKSPVFNNSMFLASISELPNLENLYLEFLPLQDFPRNSDFPIARFKHVKNFYLNVHTRGSGNIWNDEFGRVLATVQFERLESFSFISSNQDPVEYFLIGMVANHTALQKLTIDAEITLDQSLEIFASLAELKELTITWHERSSYGTWNRILAHVVTSNHTLERFTMHMSYHDSVSAPYLLQFVPDGWRFNTEEATQNPQLLYLERSK